MQTAIEMKHLLLGTIAVVGIALGFTLGLNRGQDIAHQETRAEYAPILAEKESQYLQLTQRDSKPAGISPSKQDWMPLQFRFSMLDEILTKANAIDAPRAILSRIKSLPKEEVEATLKMIHARPRDDEDFMVNFAEHALLMRFAEIDSAAALAFADATALNRRDATRAAVLAVMAETDASGAAIAALSKLDKKNAAGRSEATSAVAATWARQDPQAAVSWANTLPTPQLRADALSNAIYETPQEEWDGFVHTISNDYERNHVVGNLAQNMANYAPDAALDWAYSQPVISPSQPDPVVRVFNSVRYRRHPNRSAEYLVNLSKNTTRNRDIYNNALPQLLQDWLVTDPYGALQYAHNHPDPYIRNEVFAHMRKALVVILDLNKLTTNPDGSLNLNAAQFFCANLLLGGKTEGLGNTQEIIKQAKDWFAAAQVVREFPGAEGSFDSSMSIAEAWSAADPVAATEWLKSVDDVGIRQQAIEEQIDAVQMRQPEAAIDLNGRER
jgi:hypothetical protein